MRRALVLLLGLVLVGCASRREVGLPTVDASRVRLRLEEPREEAGGAVALEDEIGGPWRVVPAGQDLFPDEVATDLDEVLVPAVPEAPPPRPAQARRPVANAPPPSQPALPVPRRRAAREARPEGQRLARSADQLAREHFLDYPTRVRAAKVTFYCPPDYAAEVRLSGAATEDLGGGSRRAQGGARLLLRELTLEAERITLKVRRDGVPDLQLLARGGVQFVSEVRGNVMRETGLRSLMITNDRIVPLR